LNENLQESKNAKKAGSIVELCKQWLVERKNYVSFANKGNHFRQMKNNSVSLMTVISLIKYTQICA